MGKIAMVISCFEKAEEMEKFYQSIEQADLACIPRIVVINTDPLRGLTGKESIEVAQRFRRSGDRIFVAHRNLYFSSYRYAMQKYLTGYDFMIGTEADIWFEKPFRFGESIKYFQWHPNVAMLTILSRYLSAEVNETMFRDIDQWKRVDGYLNPPRNTPWHMCLIRIPCMLHYLRVGWELIDSLFTQHCRSALQRDVLSLDCRDYCVHFDYHATVEKYPHYAGLCGSKHFSLRQRPVEDKDIEEI